MRKDDADKERDDESDVDALEIPPVGELTIKSFDLPPPAPPGKKIPRRRPLPQPGKVPRSTKSKSHIPGGRDSMAKKTAKGAGPKKNAPAKTNRAAAPADVVGAFVIRETTRQPHALKALAKPPTVNRPQRIHPRRFPPRVLEGEERGVHSTTAAFAAPRPQPGRRDRGCARHGTHGTGHAEYSRHRR